MRAHWHVLFKNRSVEGFQESKRLFFHSQTQTQNDAVQALDIALDLLADAQRSAVAADARLFAGVAAGAVVAAVAVAALAVVAAGVAARSHASRRQLRAHGVSDASSQQTPSEALDAAPLGSYHLGVAATVIREAVKTDDAVMLPAADQRTSILLRR